MLDTYSDNYMALPLELLRLKFCLVIHVIYMYITCTGKIFGPSYCTCILHVQYEEPMIMILLSSIVKFIIL